MFHHAEMHGSELDAAASLLTLLRDHERTSCVPMRAVAAG
jgi:hypothetical protein